MWGYPDVEARTLTRKKIRNRFIKPRYIKENLLDSMGVLGVKSVSAYALTRLPIGSASPDRGVLGRTREIETYSSMFRGKETYDAKEFKCG